MVVSPVDVDFWCVREVAVFFNQLEHELLGAGLRDDDILARGQKYDKLGQSCKERSVNNNNHNEL